MNRSSRSTVRSLFALAVVALAIAPAPAQLDDWSAVPVSAAAATQIEQSIAIVVDGNTVRGFSGLTREWASVTTYWNAPVVTRLNDHFIVRDGPLFNGFSPRTAAFATQYTFSPGAALLAASSPQTWQSVVVDGSYVHVFFALSGQWQTYVFANPPAVTLGRQCVVIDTGAQIFAVSAYYESLVPLPVTGATLVATYGNSVIAQTAGGVHGFSAHMNTWASAAAAGPVTVTAGHANASLVAIRDGSTISFFSGITGTFGVSTASPTATLAMNRFCGLAIDGTTVYGFSPFKGTVATTIFASTPTAIVRDFLAVISTASEIVGYSPPMGEFSLPLPGSFTVQPNQQVAMVTPTGGPSPTHVYSTITNEWVPVPPLTSPSAYIGAGVVVLVDAAGGMYGFSMKGSAWHYQPSPVPETVWVGATAVGQGYVICARSGTTLWAFNPLSEQWHSTTTAAVVTAANVHHSVAVFNDGINAYGFGCFSDRWSQVPLAGTVLNTKVNVQAGVVQTASMAYGFSAFGQLSDTAEFPDYARAVSGGGRVRIDVAGETGSLAVLAICLIKTSIPTPYGTLYLDPTTMLILYQATIPAQKIVHLTMQAPVIAPLSAIPFHLQAGIVGPSGLYLTNPVAVTIY